MGTCRATQTPTGRAELIAYGAIKVRMLTTVAESDCRVYSDGDAAGAPVSPSSMWRDSSRNEQFEQLVLPHLDAAFNLARWLTRSDTDAEDVVQEAYLRALRYFSSFHGEDARTWVLRIVRN